MGRGLKERVEGLERRLILTALHEAQGVQSRAAKVLGISERVLRYKMKKYELQIKTKLSDHDRIVEISVSPKKTDG